MSSPESQKIYKASDVLMEVIEFMQERMSELELVQVCKEAFGSVSKGRDLMKDIEYLDKSMDQVVLVYFWLKNKETS